MNILFIHQNFPGQFKHLAPALAATPDHQVAALTPREGLSQSWGGVKIFPYAIKRNSGKDTHPWLKDFETKTIRAEACFNAAMRVESSGFTPDLIIAHPGWGESLFLKEVWPHAKLGIYCEYYYRASGGDIGFDPEFPQLEIDTSCRMTLRNINNKLHFEIADAAIAPTQWQANTFPSSFRDKIDVVHDGIDTDRLKPSDSSWIKLGNKLRITKQDEVVTFINRNLEPLRGYHIFLRAVPEILKRKKSVRILIVGGDEVGYGGPNKEGKTWKEVFFEEFRTRVSADEMARVHFIGKLAYPDFVRLLQLSTVHVYLSYPFVLSWSLLEAMSLQCAIVACDTDPVKEVIEHNETGKLVDFFDVNGLAASIISLLEDPQERQRLGQNARNLIVQRYDLRRVSLVKQLDWVNKLSES
ncbi:MAG: glycosyltransferase [Pseudomonadota bacterium]